VYIVIEDKETIEKYHKIFKEILTYETKKISCYVIHKQDKEESKENLRKTVFWSSNNKFWSAYKIAKNKNTGKDNCYWNVIGLLTIKPDEDGRLNKFNEINFPLDGIDRSIQGIFIKNQSNKIFVAHRGKVHTIGNILNLDIDQIERIFIIDGDQKTEVALIGELPNDIRYYSDFQKKVIDFVKIVEDFKKVDITPEMRSECYITWKKINSCNDKKNGVKNGVKKIHEKTGMNERTAKGHLDSLDHWFIGDEWKFILSKKDIDYYLLQIKNDFNDNIYKNALLAIEKNKNYREQRNIQKKRNKNTRIIETKSLSTLEGDNIQTVSSKNNSFLSIKAAKKYYMNLLAYHKIDNIPVTKIPYLKNVLENEILAEATGIQHYYDKFNNGIKIEGQKTWLLEKKVKNKDRYGNPGSGVIPSDIVSGIITIFEQRNIAEHDKEKITYATYLGVFDLMARTISCLSNTVVPDEIIAICNLENH